MPHPPVALIKFLGIDTVQVAHPPGEIVIRRFDQKVVMIAHQTVGMAHPVERTANVIQECKKGLPVLVCLVNRFSPITS